MCLPLNLPRAIQQGHFALTEPPSPLKGYLADKKQPPPYDQHKTLGIVLLQGPRRGVFLMSEVPL